MGKPDLQGIRVTAAGQLYRDDGESSLQPALNHLPVLTNPGQVSASGIPLRGLYILAQNHQVASGTLMVRVS